MRGPKSSDLGPRRLLFSEIIVNNQPIQVVKVGLGNAPEAVLVLGHLDQEGRAVQIAQLGQLLPGQINNQLRPGRVVGRVDVYKRQLYNTPEGENLSLYSTEAPEVREDKPSAAARRGRPTLRRILVIAAVVACLVVFALPAATGHGNFLTMIGVWTDDSFQFGSSGVPSQSPVVHTKPVLTEHQSDVYDTLQAALDAYGVTNVMEPTWFPEGIQPYSASVLEFPSIGKIEFDAFYLGDNTSISISYVLYEDSADARC